jgi:NAD(P)-dependent dehydrogenase (short-subunit alcohol dehydrogenase family)
MGIFDHQLEGSREMGLELYRYDGKRAVVVGAASGVGQALARLLLELGASEVIGLDVKDTVIEGVGSVRVDLMSPTSIEEALAEVGPPIHALFCCAGIAGEPDFRDSDAMVVNFIGLRHLVETAVQTNLMPKGAAIASVSTAGSLWFGWQDSKDTLLELMAISDFDEAKKFCESNDFVGYMKSKEAVSIYTMWRSWDFMKEHEIRINTLGPGPIETPLLPSFMRVLGDSARERMEAMAQPIGRFATPEEIAYPLAFLNSDAASYMVGENMAVSGGFVASSATDRIIIPTSPTAE